MGAEKECLLTLWVRKFAEVSIKAALCVLYTYKCSHVPTGSLDAEGEKRQDTIFDFCFSSYKYGIHSLLLCSIVHYFQYFSCISVLLISCSLYSHFLFVCMHDSCRALLRACFLIITTMDHAWVICIGMAACSFHWKSFWHNNTEEQSGEIIRALSPYNRKCLHKELLSCSYRK